jgi:hypothetical protein
MGNNHITNVNTLTRDNVRVVFDNTARAILAQTLTANTTNWTSTTTTTQNIFQVNKAFSVTNNSALGGALSVGGTLTCNGSATIGNSLTPANMTLWGNLEIKGTTTNTRIESNIVQVGDMNIDLGYLEVNSLANLNGAGITIGGAGGTINTRPELVYSHGLGAWQPNIDIVTRSLPDTQIAKMDATGYFMSSAALGSNVFTRMDSTSVNFGNSWRFSLNYVNDSMELQHFESSTWVPKFTYTA